MVQWEQVIYHLLHDLKTDLPTQHDGGVIGDPSPGGDQWRYTTEGTSNLKQAMLAGVMGSCHEKLGFMNESLKISEDIWRYLKHHCITSLHHITFTSHSHHIHITFTSHSPSFSDVLPDVLPSFSKGQLVVNHPWQKLPMTVGSRAGWVNLGRVVGFLVKLADLVLDVPRCCHDTFGHRKEQLLRTTLSHKYRGW